MFVIGISFFLCVLLFIFEVSSFLMFQQRVNTVMFAENDAVLVSGSYDKTVKVWDCRSRSIDSIQSMDEAKDSVSCVLVDMPCIYAGSIDGCVRCYDVRKGTMTTDTLGVPVTALALSHDGRCYLASTLDSRTRLFDRTTGKLLATYSGHTNEHYVVQCGFAFDDTAVFSGSEDGSLFAWDLVSSKTLLRSNGGGERTVENKAKTLCSLCTHPTKHHLLTGSHDGTVSLWQKPE